MTNADTQNLSKEKIQQLLTSIGSKPTEDMTQTDAVDYDWKQPHYFTHEQLNKLDDFTKKVCKIMGRKFSALCQGEFNVTTKSTTQCFADKILDQTLDSKHDDYYLAFGPDQDHLCGLISIPIQTAFTWLSQLLGDTKDEKDSRTELSQLDESLLLDIATAIVETLLEADPECAFKPAENIVKRLLPLHLQGMEELCKITLDIKKTGSENTEAYLLILCKDLEPIVGKAAEDNAKSSAKDASNAILTHLKKMRVSVNAQLASADITLKQLLDLQPNDILLLNKEIKEPIELIVNNQTVFNAQVAKTAGKNSIVITEAVS